MHWKESSRTSVYKFYARCLLSIWKELILFRTSFINQIGFKNARSFFSHSFRIFNFHSYHLESIKSSDSEHDIKSSDLEHDIKRSNKIFESSLSFNDEISSVFENFFSSNHSLINQNDRMYFFTYYSLRFNDRLLIILKKTAQTLKREFKSTEIIIWRS